MKIEKLFENDDLVVINKPAGLVVHSDGRTPVKQKGLTGQAPELNLCDWILENYPETENVGEPIVLSDGRKTLLEKTAVLDSLSLTGQVKRPGIVHRLDRETSGVLVIAKNQKTFLCLKKQFQNREIKKIYNAFVWGLMKNDEGVIDRPIGKSKKDFRLWSAQRGARGLMREAITEYKVLRKTDKFSFLEINLKTGRTHQIRVHLKAVNHPVVGDKLYAPKREYVLGFKRLALHAKSIEFVSPNGEKIKTEAPLPDDFKKAFELL